ncbi:MAG: spermidine/putrescine ABC transporter substrate-binding protein, partial [Clostridiales bacterium]|nr:spermidine/putrescine ABC transporter substrate-binding protein [Clostridiales bacterium]
TEETSSQTTEVTQPAEQPSDKKGTFTIFTWEGMFPQEILDGFEAETGYEVNYANFDFDETMLAKLQAAKGGDYDLVIADDYIIETSIAENLVQKLDTSKLKNYGNINPIYQKQFYDPTDEYTVPYGAGVLTLIYDPAATSVKVDSFASLWDETLKDSVGLIANYRVIDGIALKVLGESFNTDDLDVIQRAGDKLLELAPNVRVIKDDELQNDIISGEITAGMLYTSQAFLAKLERPELEIAFPSEGVGFGIMAGFIPSAAPNPDAAYAFLDYIMDPQRGAECFEYLGYYSTYSASDPLISDEYRDLLTLPEGFNVDMEMIENISAEANEKHEQVWTAFKTAAGQE